MADKRDESDNPVHQRITMRPRTAELDTWILASTKLGRPVGIDEPYPCLCVKDCKGWGHERGERCLCRARTDLVYLPMTCCAHWYKERKRPPGEYGGNGPRARPVVDTDPL